MTNHPICAATESNAGSDTTDQTNLYENAESTRKARQVGHVDELLRAVTETLSILDYVTQRAAEMRHDLHLRCEGEDPGTWLTELEDTGLEALLDVLSTIGTYVNRVQTLPDPDERDDPFFDSPSRVRDRLSLWRHSLPGARNRHRDVS